MPLMFDREEFQVTICDQLPGNYAFEEASDLLIYDEYPEISAVYPQDTNALNKKRSDRTTNSHRRLSSF
ncbi:MAG: hypothetical protein IJP92_18175, partial [Lachnospiraceae bacterium]|nr:hypothetical protein [Lachnospiraceae bacterium]